MQLGQIFKIDICFLEESWSKKLAAAGCLANFLCRIMVCPCSHYYVLVTKTKTTPHCITLNPLIWSWWIFSPCWSCQCRQLVTGLHMMDPPLVSLTRPRSSSFLANERRLIVSVVFCMNLCTWKLCLCQTYQNTWHSKLTSCLTSFLRTTEKGNLWS